MLQRLSKNYDIPVQGITQGGRTMNEPMTKVEAWLEEGTIRHEHNPVLAWNVANATMRRSSTGLMYLDKSNVTRRIDGLAAVLDGLAGAIVDPMAGPSIYETRGLFVI
jgi:phage terminase large subunit-like protein